MADEPQQHRHLDAGEPARGTVRLDPTSSDPRTLDAYRRARAENPEIVPMIRRQVEARTAAGEPAERIAAWLDVVAGECANMKDDLGG